MPVQFAPVASQHDELNLRSPQIDTNPQPLLTYMKLWIYHIELEKEETKRRSKFTALSGY